MKVLQIINSLNIGGAEKLVSDLVYLLNEKAIDTDALILIESKTFLYDRIKEYKVQFLTSGSPYNPFLIFKIIPILKKYDVIHIHLFPSLYWVVLAKMFSGSKTKLIYTEHNTNNNRRNSRMGKMMDNFIYSFLDKMITISPEVDRLLKVHISEKQHHKMKIISNGVDLKLIQNAIPYSKSILNQNENDVMMLQVSSFREQKDQATVIAALQYLPSNYHLMLAGDGPLINKMKQLTEQLKLTERVHFLGLRDDIPRLLKSVDYVILSSVYEGLSLASVEGMASGKPFLASNVPGLSEIVGGYGVLFEKGNANDLAEKILQLSTDDEYKNQIIHQCIDRAKDFDISVMIDEYMAVYQSIM